MRKTLVFILSLICFAACQEVERPEKPENFIEEERFKDILYDVSLINAARDFSRLQLRNAGIEPDTFIYDKYGIDSTQFAQNVAYYSVDFSRYQKMWESVSERIERKRKVIDSLVRRQDSINALQTNDTIQEEPRTGLMDPDRLRHSSEQD